MAGSWDILLDVVVPGRSQEHTIFNMLLVLGTCFILPAENFCLCGTSVYFLGCLTIWTQHLMQDFLLLNQQVQVLELQIWWFSGITTSYILQAVYVPLFVCGINICTKRLNKPIIPNSTLVFWSTSYSSW